MGLGKKETKLYFLTDDSWLEKGCIESHRCSVCHDLSSANWTSVKIGK